jgi:hypothetical protein
MRYAQDATRMRASQVGGIDGQLILGHVNNVSRHRPTREGGVTATDVILAAIIISCAGFSGWWLLFYRRKE